MNNTYVLFYHSWGWFDGWRETGFLRRYSMRGEDIGKNPVSETVGGGEKPGFYEDIRCEAKISEKTRFLRLCMVARNRVFAKIFDARRRHRKKPGF
ncbi:MAG: hypothetical protein JGK31_18170 [Microcoleus sp. PH2017_30_WIL_O_A]|nr:hypothetical protein [Microcoleus sp. PH2017_30_WIL_O_A]